MIAPKDTTRKNIFCQCNDTVLAFSVSLPSSLCLALLTVKRADFLGPSAVAMSYTALSSVNGTWNGQERAVVLKDTAGCTQQPHVNPGHYFNNDLVTSKQTEFINHILGLICNYFEKLFLVGQRFCVTTMTLSLDVSFLVKS